MKLAFVYDRINKFGGAERVLLALHKIWPKAPFYTSVYNSQTAPWAKNFKIKTSFLQKAPFAKSHHQLYPWLMPLVFESFNFDEFDVVISITSEFAKGIITKPHTLHICYCLTPARYLWSGYWDYPIKAWMFPIVSRLRLWDQLAAQRPDIYIAISKTVQARIKKYYKRDSEVIYPGIEIKKIKNQKSKIKNQKFFLIVSRLVPYKRVDLAVQAFNQLGWPLKIIGSGREIKRLKKLAKQNIEFLGQLTDREILSYYQSCHALIFPGEEDLGLTPLEAQAIGKPVIAFKKGGALETVIEGKTGLFFKDKTVKSLIECLRKFKSLKLKTKDCQKQAKKFDVEIFQKQFQKFVERKWEEYEKY